MTRTKVVGATREDDLWRVETRDSVTGQKRVHRARMLVNAAGPWVGELIHDTLRLDTKEGVRLVRGSHIVTEKLYDHDKAYFFQGEDGRIIFSIPYEQDFTLIGTTDVEHGDPDTPAACTPEEQSYLLAFANSYFKRTLTDEDVVWTYSGVRPLFDDGADNASAATRDYLLKVDAQGAPVLNIFGGKITTYRKLAEGALEKISEYLEVGKGAWTAGVPLPGGDFPVDGVAALTEELRRDYPFLDAYWAGRLVRAYGSEAKQVLGAAKAKEDLGAYFGATLTAAEVAWLMEREYARTAEDVVWRRSKLGLRMSEGEIAALDAWMAAAVSQDASH